MANTQTYIGKAKKKKEPKYPEVWFIYDGVGYFIGYVAANPEDKHPDKFHVILSAGLPGYPNPYFDELERMILGLGDEIYQLPEMVDGTSGGLMVAPVDKEEALTAFTNAGFMAKRAKKDDHEELLREMDKLQTTKGGESKRYTRAKS